MALLKKKTSLVHHITYMGIMAAINLIFIVLATYLPFLMFIPIIFLPFASAIVSYYCLKRYYPIYAVVTIGLCLIFNINDTIFYIVPAIIAGFFIGYLLTKRVNPFWLILVSTIIESALTFAFIPLINVISNVDIVETFISAFKLDGFAYKTELTYLFIFFISLIQCGLTHFVLLSDAKKIGIEINIVVNSYAPYIIGLEVSLILMLVISLFYLPLALIFLAISLYFSIFLLIDILVSKKIIIYVLLVVLFLAAFFSFAIFYTKVIAPFGILLMSLFPFVILLISFIKNCLLKGGSNI
jgi:hypothetical protein